MSSSVTQLKVDLAALRRAEVTLEAASASILATKQDQGSLQACVGDAPRLRDALGRLAGNWAIHRERLLTEIEGLKSNITTYRTKIETLDNETAKAITGQVSGEATTPRPSSGPPAHAQAPTPSGSGGGTPPATPPPQPSCTSGPTAEPRGCPAASARHPAAPGPSAATRSSRLRRTRPEATRGD